MSVADGDGSSLPSQVPGGTLVGEDNIFKRGLAWAIDIFLLYGLLLNLVLPAASEAGVPRGVVLEAVSILGVTSLYFVGLWVWTGQTLGKKLFGLRVVRADGTPLGLGRAAFRYGTYVVMVLPFFLGILFSTLFLILGSGRQGLHDKLAGTLVVRVR